MYINTVLEKRCQALSLLPQQLLLVVAWRTLCAPALWNDPLSYAQVHQSGSGWSPVVSATSFTFYLVSEKTYFWGMCACMCLSMWMTTWQSCLLASCLAAQMMLWSGEAQRRTVCIDKFVFGQWELLCFSLHNHTQSGPKYSFWCMFFVIVCVHRQGWSSSSWGTSTGENWITLLWTRPRARQMSIYQLYSTWAPPMWTAPSSSPRHRYSGHTPVLWWSLQFEASNH